MSCRNLLLPLAVVLLGFGLRVGGILHQGVWPDEAYSYAASHWTFSELAANLRIDNVPLYTILLGAWHRFAGPSELSLRYFSVVVATPSVALTYAIGRRLINSRAGIAAGHDDPAGVVDAWLGSHAIRESSRDLGGGLRLELWLTRPPLASTIPPDAVAHGGSIDDQVTLAGSSAGVTAPGTPAVAFYWSVKSPMQDDFTVSVHLLGPDGRLVAQKDEQPYGGQFVTSRWPSPGLVRDAHQVALPARAPSGAYRIEAGFYRLSTMERLGTPPNDLVRIPVWIGPPATVGPARLLLTRLPAPLRVDERLPPGAVTSC